MAFDKAGSYYDLPEAILRGTYHGIHDDMEAHG